MKMYTNHKESPWGDDPHDPKQHSWVNNVLRQLACYGYCVNPNSKEISITSQLSQDVINPAHGSLLRANFPSIDAVWLQCIVKAYSVDGWEVINKELILCWSPLEAIRESLSTTSAPPLSIHSVLLIEEHHSLNDWMNEREEVPR